MNLETLKNFVKTGMDKCRVLVVGDAMLDKYYFGEVTRISPEAPVPINKVVEVRETLGGAANVAHNLSLLGCQTSIAARIGNENHGETLIRKLNSRNIDSACVIKTFLPTTTKIRIISGHQQMLRLDFEDTAALEGTDAEKFLSGISARLKDFDAVIISDYGKGVCTEKVCKRLPKSLLARYIACASTFHSSFSAFQHFSLPCPVALVNPQLWQAPPTIRFLWSHNLLEFSQ